MDGFILKILNGSQFGAEVMLSAGEYSLGSGGEDDLQFNDLSLEASHGRLRVSAGRVEIRAEAGGISSANGLNLEPGEQQWREIEQLDVLSAGTTRFAIGARTANWTSILDSLRNADPSAATLPGNTSGSKRPKMNTAMLLGAAAVVLVAAGVFFYAIRWERTEVQVQKVDPAAELAAVSEAIADLAFPNTLKVRQEADGAIFVSGYVTSPAQRRAALKAVDDTGAQASMRVWVLDVLRNGVEGLVESLGYNVDYELTEEGVLILRGVLLDKSQAERLTALLNEQVVGLREVRSEIRTAQDLFAEVEALAKKTKISDTVLLRLDGLLIEASGLIATDKIDIWAGFIESYVRHYAKLIPLRSYVQLAESGAGAPSIAAPRDESGRAYGVTSDDGSQFYGPNGEDLPPNTSALDGDRPVAGRLPYGEPWNPASAGLDHGAARREWSSYGVAPLVIGRAALGDGRPVEVDRIIAGEYAMGELFAAPPAGGGPVRGIFPEVRDRSAGGAGESAAFLPGMNERDPGEAGVLFGGTSGLHPDDGHGAFPGGADRAGNGGAAADAWGSPGLGRTAGSGRDSGGADGGAGGAFAAGASAADRGTGSAGGAGGAFAAGGSAADRGTGSSGGAGGGFAAGGSAADGGAGGGFAAGGSAADRGTGSSGGADDGRAPGGFAGGSGVAEVEEGPGSGRAAIGAMGIDAGGIIARGSGPGRPAGNRTGMGDAQIAAFLSELAAKEEEHVCGGAPAAAGAFPQIGGANPFAAIYAAGPGEPVELAGLTRRLIEAWRDGDLAKGNDQVAQIDSAIHTIAHFRTGTRKAAAEAGIVAGNAGADPFAQIGHCPPSPQQCWPGSHINGANLPVALFWLDLLAITDAIALSRFSPYNQALILEAGLNPKRASACAARGSSDPAAAISIYLADSIENPRIVNRIAGALGRFPIVISGASLKGTRFVQTVEGERLREGAAPTGDSRLIHIGELGTYFRTSRGLAITVYDPRMTWYFDG